MVLALTDTQKEGYDRDWRSVELNNQWRFPDSGIWSSAWGGNHAYKPYTIELLKRPKGHEV